MASLDDPLLARLGHLNYLEFSRELARETGPGGAILEEAGVLLHASDSPMPVLLNGAWRVDPGVAGLDVVARANAFFGPRARGYSVNVRDGVAADEDLRAAAIDAGLVELMSAPEMVLRARLDPSEPAPGVDLRWVEDASTFADFVSVNDRAYSTLGMPVGTVSNAFTDPELFFVPHVHSVVAYVDGEAAAAAQVILSHGISGVYWVGTVEAARGRGLGEAVTRAVSNRAFDEGARAVTLQASPMGEPIYLRMGYETLYRYATFVCSEPPSS